MLVIATLLSVALAASAGVPTVSSAPKTFCNPVNVDYRLMTSEKLLYREAADPVAMRWNGHWLLFASHSGGYWWSDDFNTWTLVVPTSMPTSVIDAYAPAVVEFQGALYFTASATLQLWRTTNPLDPGSWERVAKLRWAWDPDLFEDNGRLYFAWGSMRLQPTHVVELDPKNGFAEVGTPVIGALGHSTTRGWEVCGDNNVPKNKSYVDEAWVEGSWMTKHGDTYYLQYAAPGTEFVTYGDGVFTAKSPLGPFVYAEHSPFSFKPTGFMPCAGHSSTFQDANGWWWHISTGCITVVHNMERRLTVLPAWFDNEDRLYANAYRADLPQYLPGLNPHPGKSRDSNLAGWELLSYGKPVKSSSELEGHPAANAADENIKTFWSAITGNPGEWFAMDLGSVADVFALQVNFAEVEMNTRGRLNPLYQQYTLEVSLDGRKWETLVNKTGNLKDAPHDYMELTEPLATRYLRVTNVAESSKILGLFSLRDLRVFGRGRGKIPAVVPWLNVALDQGDMRHAFTSWGAVEGAEGYVLSYGLPGALNTHFEIRGKTELDLHSLNVGVKYMFTVQAFNENGSGPISEAVPI